MLSVDLDESPTDPCGSRPVARSSLTVGHVG
jgi:hypothetical protein